MKILCSVLTIAFILIASIAFAWDATVTWQAPTQYVTGDSLDSGDIAGYLISYGPQSGIYTTNQLNIGNVLEYTITGINDEAVYIVVQTLLYNGEISGYSNEVAKINEEPTLTSVTIYPSGGFVLGGSFTTGALSFSRTMAGGLVIGGNATAVASGGTGYPITYVNTTTGTGNSLSPTIATSAGNHTSGNLLVAVITADYTSSRVVSAVTDSASNTYEFAARKAVTGGDVEIWYAKNIVGNSSNVVTATFTGSVAYRRIAVLQYSGANTSSPFDVIGVGTGTSSSMSTAAVATNVANEAIVAGYTYWNIATPTAGTNFTLRAILSDFAVEDRIVNATGSYASTMSISSSLQYIGLHATFKQASPGSAVSLTTSMTGGLLLGGQSSRLKGRVFDMSDGILLGGTASYSIGSGSVQSATKVMSGGIVFNSYNTAWARGKAKTMTGGLRLGGSIIIGKHHSISFGGTQGTISTMPKGQTGTSKIRLGE